MGNRQSNNSLPVEQDNADSNYRSSLIARESDVSDEELEHGQHAEMRSEKRRRIMYEQSIVVYGEEQGSSSNSQLTSQLVSLYNNSAVYPRIVILTEKLNHLSAQRCDVLKELENAEIQPGKKRREVVQHWFTEVQRKEHKIQTMIEDGQESNSNSNLSLYIESFIKEVDELIQRGKFPNGLVLLDQESTRLPLLLDMKPVGTSFQRNTERILGWLQNHDRCIIGVHGMGGVGKTMLLTHIHNLLLQESNLSQKIGQVYWVTVSENCPVHKLQKDIAKALGLEDIKEDDERKRAAVLHNRLAARGQTVLILDDMWEQVSETRVGIPVENKKCKIILSTRLYDVCRKMSTEDFVIKVEVLQKDEAWELFVEKLGRQYDKLEEKAKKIAREIAEECGGLPLAIATMARSMTGIDDINDWSTALSDLKSARDQADMKEDVFRILQYSYNRLNDKRVQNCFLSCILYEEDAKIKRTTLIDLWINEGLLDDIKSREALSKGHTILNKLESSCLLESMLDSDEEECMKMHDLIRDMGIIITKEDPLFIAEAGKQLKEVPEEEKWSKDLVKVSFSHNDIEEIPSGMTPMTPNLTVLMLNENPLKKIPDSFFVHMKALTVLDLSGTEIERVPESVSDLENLRSLRLVECYELTYVPSVAKLTKLRTLDLHGCWDLEEAPRGLERLKSVEKLSYIPWDVSDLIGFNKLIQSLTSSIFSKIFIIPSAAADDDDDYRLRFYESYDKVVWIEGGKFGEDKSNWLLPTTLERLEIYKCDLKGRSFDVVFPSLSEATVMKELNIVKCKGLESISASSGTHYGSSLLFTNLENIWLSRLPDLRSIAKIGAPHSFTHLRELEIDDCPKMKVVLPVTGTMELLFPKLESIVVDKCEVEEIFESNKATLSIPHIILPELKRLSLDGLPKIKVIFPFSEELHVPNLETIFVGGCEEVEEIFGSNKATLPSNPKFSLCLDYLARLNLEKLPKLKVIFPFSEEFHLPDLVTIDVQKCEEEEIFGTNKATLTSNPIFSLPNLKSLELIDLPKLKVNLKQFNLSKLERIELVNCGKIEEMFGLNKDTLFNPLLDLSSLEHLELCSLSNLKVIFPFTEQIHLQNLRRIKVSNCKEVEEIFQSSKATPCNPVLALPNLHSMELNDLPNLRSIWNGIHVGIPKLSILDATGCWKLEEASSRELERLKWVENVGYMPRDVSSDRIRFHEVMQSLTSLSFYRILIGDGDPTFLCQSFDKRRGFHMYEKVVWIRGGELGEDKSNFLLPTTLKCLGIEECYMEGGCLGDFLQSLVKSLKQIVLSKCRGLEYVIGSSGTQQGSLSSHFTYLNLDIIVLVGLPDLRSIANFGAKGHFSRIRRLYISECPKIKVVLPAIFVKQVYFQVLEIIRVENCEEVDEIFETKEVAVSNQHVGLPRLKLLQLCSLPRLKVIFPSPSTMEVEEIEWLKKISDVPIPTDFLHNLTGLYLRSLPEIKVVFPFPEGQLLLPCLRSIEVEECYKLEEIFKSKKTSSLKPIFRLPTLRSLKLKDLPNLHSISKGMLFYIPHLKLESIPTTLQDRQNTGLTQLPDVSDCPMLKLWRYPSGLVGDEPDR